MVSVNVTPVAVSHDVTGSGRYQGLFNTNTHPNSLIHPGPLHNELTSILYRFYIRSTSLVGSFGVSMRMLVQAGVGLGCRLLVVL